MAHTISTTRSNTARPHPDASRIAGLATAITFNTALLMLLLVPMQTPPLSSMSNVIEPITWIMPETDPPTPPVPVPVTPPPQVPTPMMPTVIQPPAVTAPVVEQVIVDQGTVQADAIPPPAETAGPATRPADPLPGVRLEYASAPAPAYPPGALRARLEGTVLLQVLVDTDGRPLDVQVYQSSGHHELDDAARRHVLKRWSFRSAMQDGRAVQAIGLVPIAFSLDR